MISFKVLFVVFALLAAAVVAQEDIQLLDDFSSTLALGAPIITGQTANTATGSQDDNTVLGGSRDLGVRVDTAEDNLVISSSVAAGIWSVALPFTDSPIAGVALLQYDGPDEVTTLNGDPTVNGLQNYDLTIGGLGDALHVIIKNDLATTYTFTFYDANNQISTYTLPVPNQSATPSFIDYYVPFSDLSGNADITNLGALEIAVDFSNPVDTAIQPIFVSGPAPQPAASIPPVPSPAPVPVANGFTWYTFDDDDNGRSPCGDEAPRRSYFLSDNNIVYYYFFGFDFTTQEASSSDAATAIVSTAAAVVAVAVALF